MLPIALWLFSSLVTAQQIDPNTGRVLYEPGPHVEAIAGGVVGGVLVLALIALAVWWFRRRSPLRSERALPHPVATPFHVSAATLPSAIALQRAMLEKWDHGPLSSPSGALRGADAEEHINIGAQDSSRTGTTGVPTSGSGGSESGALRSATDLPPEYPTSRSGTD
ncbi:hypothetical protein FB45DRAFT_1144249 [Roridomyces roridus]|uniref:Uncharacterized protein n=1 Tax=Roridomyces roridus TaxID=1738132 RepID=A0AAD7AZX8_9AGAR|nr:hypothetical protein FB45DRAFT_1144249 [Roridomyces roridus]